MSANRPRDTKPELTLAKALYHSGHRGYRINYRIKLQKPARNKGIIRNSLLTKEGWLPSGEALLRRRPDI